MSSNPIEATKNDLVMPSVYRHFRGGYYIVQTVASVESNLEPVVVYQSLQDGRVWTRPYTEFFEEVPGDKVNPTGQKHRFERVEDFNNQLKMIPTDALVEELSIRKDFDGLSSVDSVWKTLYYLGTVEERFVGVNEDSYEGFSPITSPFDTYEEAEDYYNRKLGSLPVNTVLLKVVCIKGSFD